ncbi:MAG: hypothetical protein WKF40_08680 [Thermoleophilaceae bacterium]
MLELRWSLDVEGAVGCRTGSSRTANAADPVGVTVQLLVTVESGRSV